MCVICILTPDAIKATVLRLLAFLDQFEDLGYRLEILRGAHLVGDGDPGLLLKPALE